MDLLPISIGAIVVLLLVICVVVRRRQKSSEGFGSAGELVMDLVPQSVPGSTYPYLWHAAVKTREGLYSGLADTGSPNAVFVKAIPEEQKTTRHQVYGGGKLAYHTGELQLPNGRWFPAGGGATGSVGKGTIFNGVLGLLPYPHKVNGLRSFTDSILATRITIDIPREKLVIGGAGPRGALLYSAPNAHCGGLPFVCINIRFIRAWTADGKVRTMYYNPRDDTRTFQENSQPEVHVGSSPLTAVLDTGTTAGITTLSKAGTDGTDFVVARLHVGLPNRRLLKYTAPPGEEKGATFPSLAEFKSNPPQLLLGNQLLRNYVLSYTVARTPWAAVGHVTIMDPKN